MDDPTSVHVPGAEVSPEWAAWRSRLPIEQYEARFSTTDPADRSAHGEADFIAGYRPRRVLDAGCGTGRVAIELHRMGIDVVGTDLDADMLAAAAAKSPDIPWILADLALIGTDEPNGSEFAELSRPFDVVAMPGNVMLYCRPDSRRPIVTSLAEFVAPGGRLIAGFSLGHGVTIDEYDRYCRDAGLALEAHYSGWDGAPFDAAVGSHDYVVAVHVRE